jgi:hypothetical protein
MQTKIVLIVDELLKKISTKTTPLELDATKKALTKYYLLYADLTNPTEAQRLSDKAYRATFIQSAGVQEKYKAMQEKIIKIRTKEKISAFHDEIESLVS